MSFAKSGSELAAASAFSFYTPKSTTGGSTGTSSAGAPATVLPSSPVDKQQAILTDSASSPTYVWLLQWSGTASKWFFVGGSPQSSEVDTAEARNSLSYGDCATVHSLTLVNAGVYEMTFGCTAMVSSTQNNNYYMSPKYSASEAADADSAQVVTSSIVTGNTFQIQRTRRITVASANQVVTMRYKQSTADTNTKVANRYLKVIPVTLT